MGNCIMTEIHYDDYDIRKGKGLDLSPHLVRTHSEIEDLKDELECMRQKVEFYEQIIQHEEKYFLWYHTTEAESDRSSGTDSDASSGITDDYYFKRQKSIRKGQLPVAAQMDHSNRYFSDSSKQYKHNLKKLELFCRNTKPDV